jgi:hypothetical protein
MPNGILAAASTQGKGDEGQGRSVFRLFNPEPTATAANPEKNTVAVGSGLNDPLPILNF